MKYSIFSKKAAIVEFSHLTFQKFKIIIRKNPLKVPLAVNFSLKLFCREMCIKCQYKLSTTKAMASYLPNSHIKT